MRNKSDTERLLEIRDLENRGHHYQASLEYQRMGNEYRKPQEKKALWGLADKASQRHWEN